MRVALIEPIGNKMGMNHYNDGLMHELSKKGFETFILSNYKSSFENVSSVIFFQNKNKYKVINAWYYFSGMIRSILFCKKEKIKYAMFHIFRGGFFDLISLAFAKILRLKIVLIVHDIETIDTTPNKFIKRLVLLYFHDIMVVHNRFSLEKIKEYTGQKNPRQIHCIPHGNYIHYVEKLQYPVTDAHEYFRLNPSDRHLLFFGQIKKTKGLDVLLEAMSLVKSNVKLIIAGKLRIKNFESYQEFINKYQLQDRVIKILRYLNDDEAARLFSVCNAVVIPYKVIYQSGVLLLAMSYGKTVIASDLPPFKEMIQHEKNGFLFKNNNPPDLARMIDEVFLGKFELEKIGKNAKQFVLENYSWDKIADQYSKLLSK